MRTHGRWKLSRHPIQGAGYKVYGYIEIIKKRRVRLGDLTEEDARREGFASLEALREAWTRLYGHPWNPDEEVWIYTFRLIERRIEPTPN